MLANLVMLAMFYTLIVLLLWWLAGPIRTVHPF